MTNLKKVNEILSLVVSAATAVVALAEIWEKIGSDVKRVIKPVIDGCKRIASAESDPSPLAIENK